MSNVSVNPKLANDLSCGEVVLPCSTFTINGTLKANILKAKDPQTPGEYEIRVDDGTKLVIYPEKTIKDHALALRKVITPSNTKKGLLFLSELATTAAVYIYRLRLLAMLKSCYAAGAKMATAMATPLHRIVTSLPNVATPIIVIGGIYYLVKKICDNKVDEKNGAKAIGKINPDFRKNLVKTNSDNKIVHGGRRSSCIPANANSPAANVQNRAVDLETPHKKVNHTKEKSNEIDHKLNKDDKKSSNKTIAKSNSENKPFDAQMKNLHEEKETVEQNLYKKLEDDTVDEKLHEFPKMTVTQLSPTTSQEEIKHKKVTPIETKDKQSDKFDALVPNIVDSYVTNSVFDKIRESNPDIQMVTIIGDSSIINKAKSLTEYSDMPWAEDEMKVTVLSPKTKPSSDTKTPKRSPKHKSNK